MAGFLGKVTAFARTPQGRKLIAQAQAAAKDPATRAKVQELSKKLKDPATRAKVTEQARGLTERFKEGRDGKSGPAQGQQRPAGQQPPADGPAYGTPPSTPKPSAPNEAPRYGQPPQN